MFSRIGGDKFLVFARAHLLWGAAVSLIATVFVSPWLSVVRLIGDDPAQLEQADGDAEFSGIAAQ